MIISFILVIGLLTAALIYCALRWQKCQHKMLELQSESGFHQELFEALPGIGYVLDAADFKVCLCNQKCADFVHLQKDDLLGQAVADLFPAELAQELVALAKDTAHCGADQERFLSYTLSDGVCRRGQFWGICLPQASGKKLLLCFAIDLGTASDSEQEWQQLSQMYLAILEQLPCLLYVKDFERENRYLLSSQLFHSQLGLPFGSMQGKNDFDLFGRELAEKYIADDAVVMQSGEVLETVENFSSAVVGMRTYHTYKVCLPREEGNLLLGVSQDVTELLLKNDSVQRTNKALHGYIKQQQVITSCLAYLMVDDDDDTSIQKVLRSFCEHLQASRCNIMICDDEADEMLLVYEHCSNEQPLDLPFLKVRKIPREKTWFQHLCDREILAYNADTTENNLSLFDLTEMDWLYGLEVKSLYASGIFFSGKLWGGLLVTYEENNHKLTAQERQLLRAASHIVEIILQRKRNHMRLEQALLDAQNANAAKSFFLATMSHEIRTPLNAVIGFSELLQHGDLTEEEYQDCVSSINLAGNALLGLINDILDLSKIEADQMIIVPQVTDVPAFVEELRAVFWQSAKSKGLSLDIDYPQDLPLLELDSLRLRQILFNLLGNAIKFTEYGGVRVALAFQKNADQSGQLSVSVSDTGIGIEAEAQEKVFAPFVQQDAVRDSRAFKGTGLGLAISRRLADCMGGKLSLQSVLGQGSTFTLQLPGVAVSDQLPEKFVSQIAASGDYFPIKALLVDDVSMNLKVLLAMLRKLAVIVEASESGAEALLKMQQNVPQVVFTDIWMPEMNGYELLEKIHSQAQWREVRVVAVTADTGVAQSHKMGGFDAILLKPVTMAKIKVILTQLNIVHS